jgi:hypothetical protein
MMRTITYISDSTVVKLIIWRRATPSPVAALAAYGTNTQDTANKLRSSYKIAPKIFIKLP